MTDDPLERSSDAIAPELQAEAAPRGLTLAVALAGRGVELSGFRHVSEREAGPWICCANASGAMVAAYLGACPATLTAAHELREAAGVPHRGGMRPSQVRDGTRAAFGVELRPVARDRDRIAGRLAEGWAIVVPHDYAKLPAELRRYSPGFTGGHSAVLAGLGAGGSWGWWDPLAPKGWQGEYVSPAAIVRAAWSDGIMGAKGGGDDVTIRAAPELTSGWRIDLPAGTVFYKDAAGSDELLTWRQGHTIVWAGWAGQSWAVIVNTSKPYADDVARDTICYVPMAATPARPYEVADPPAPGEGVLAAARLEGRRLEWQRWAASQHIPAQPEVPE